MCGPLVLLYNTLCGGGGLSPPPLDPCLSSLRNQGSNLLLLEMQVRLIVHVRSPPLLLPLVDIVMPYVYVIIMCNFN